MNGIAHSPIVNKMTAHPKESLPLAWLEGRLGISFENLVGGPWPAKGSWFGKNWSAILFMNKPDIRKDPEVMYHCIQLAKKDALDYIQNLNINHGEFINNGETCIVLYSGSLGSYESYYELMKLLHGEERENNLGMKWITITKKMIDDSIELIKKFSGIDTYQSKTEVKQRNHSKLRRFINTLYAPDKNTDKYYWKDLFLEPELNANYLTTNLRDERTKAIANVILDKHTKWVLNNINETYLKSLKDNQNVQFQFLEFFRINVKRFEEFGVERKYVCTGALYGKENYEQTIISLKESWPLKFNTFDKSNYEEAYNKAIKSVLKYVERLKEECLVKVDRFKLILGKRCDTMFNKFLRLEKTIETNTSLFSDVKKDIKRGEENVLRAKNEIEKRDKEIVRMVMQDLSRANEHLRKRLKELEEIVNVRLKAKDKTLKKLEEKLKEVNGEVREKAYQYMCKKIESGFKRGIEVCCVCFDRKINTVLIPCGHVKTCFLCAMHLEGSHEHKCPICRKDIENVNKVYF